MWATLITHAYYGCRLSLYMEILYKLVLSLLPSCWTGLVHVKHAWVCEFAAPVKPKKKKEEQEQVVLLQQIKASHLIDTNSTAASDHQLLQFFLHREQMSTVGVISNR